MTKRNPYAEMLAGRDPDAERPNDTPYIQPQTAETPDFSWHAQGLARVNQMDLERKLGQDLFNEAIRDEPLHATPSDLYAEMIVDQAGKLSSTPSPAEASAAAAGREYPYKAKLPPKPPAETFAGQMGAAAQRQFGGATEALGTGMATIARQPTLPLERSEILDTPLRMGRARPGETEAALARSGEAVARFGKGTAESAPGPAVPRMTDIKSAKDVGVYLAEKFAEGLGSTAPMIAGGIVGGPGAILGAGMSMGVGQVVKQMEEERESLMRQAVQAREMGLDVAAEKFARMAANLTPQAQNGIINASGALVGMLDSVIPMALAGGLGREQLREMVRRHAVASIAKHAAMGSVTEGMTEVTQDAIAIVAIARAKGYEAAQDYADELYERRWDLAESLVGGAIPGAGFGAVIGGRGVAQARGEAQAKSQALFGAAGGKEENPYADALQQPEAQPEPATPTEVAQADSAPIPAESVPNPEIEAAVEVWRQAQAQMAETATEATDAVTQQAAPPVAQAVEDIVAELPPETQAQVKPIVDAVIEASPEVAATVAEPVANVPQEITRRLEELGIAQAQTEQQVREIMAQRLDPAKRLTEFLAQGGSLTGAPEQIARQAGVGSLGQLTQALQSGVAQGALRRTMTGRIAPVQQTRPATAQGVRQTIQDIARQMAPILPRGTTVKSFKELAEIPGAYSKNMEQRGDVVTAGGNTLDAFAGNLDNNIYIADYALNPAGRIAHEGVHALQTVGLISPQEVALLAERGRKVGVMTKQDVQRYETLLKKRFPNDWKQRLDEEHAAHLIEARVNGEDFGRKVNSIVDRVIEFIRRLGNALRGMGFQTTDDVVDAMLSGEMARRAPVLEWMRENDIYTMAVRDRGVMAAFSDSATGQSMRRGMDAQTARLNDFRAWWSARDAAARRMAEQNGAVLIDDVVGNSNPRVLAFHGTRRSFEKFAATSESQTVPAVWFGQLKDADQFSAPWSERLSGQRTIPSIIDTTGFTRVDWTSYAKTSPEVLTDDPSIYQGGVMEKLLAEARDSGSPGLVIEAISPEMGLTNYVVVLREEGRVTSPTGGQVMFAFAGERAKTADLDALARAKEMEAEGPKRGEPGFDEHRTRIWTDTGWFRAPDGRWKWEIDDSGAKWNLMTALEQETGPLSVFMRNPNVFSAYPDLQNVRASSQGMGASYAPASDTLRVGRLQVGQHPTSTAVHEVQHAVQGRENFAEGANLEIARRTPEYAAAIELYRNAPPDDGWTSVNAQTPDTIADGVYRQFAGEVEARAVQKRMDMTPEQRRARPPWLDYDVPEDQQIFRFANGLSVSQLSYSAEPPIEGFPTIKGEVMFAIRAFHGSPHDFDRFDISRIGTGEGAQAYGSGLYFAESRDVADSYRNALAPRNVPSSPLKAPSDVLRRDAEKLGQLLVANPLLVEGMGALDIKARSDVLSVMRGLLNDSEIARAVVRLVPVDVMNVLSGKQLSTKALLDNPSMLVDLLPVNADDTVSSRVAAVDVLAPYVALAAAERPLIGTQGRALLEKALSARAASQGNLRHSGEVPYPSQYGNGRLYEVRINANPEDFLDWDKPLSQQSEKVRKSAESAGWKTTEPRYNEADVERLKAEQAAAKQRYEVMRSEYFADAWKNPRKSEGEFNNRPDVWRARQDIHDINTKIDDAIKEREAMTGKGVLDSMMSMRDRFGIGDQSTSVQASQRLRDAGIPGIRYLDQGSRAKGEGSRNYVVFDDSLIEIVAKDGKPIEKGERQSVIDGMMAKPEGADGSGPMFAMGDPPEVRSLQTIVGDLARDLGLVMRQGLTKTAAGKAAARAGLSSVYDRTTGVLRVTSVSDINAVASAIGPVIRHRFGSRLDDVILRHAQELSGTSQPDTLSTRQSLLANVIKTHLAWQQAEAQFDAGSIARDGLLGARAQNQEANRNLFNAKQAAEQAMRDLATDIGPYGMRHATTSRDAILQKIDVSDLDQVTDRLVAGYITQTYNEELQTQPPQARSAMDGAVTGFERFARLYVMNPREARETYPTFTRAFERAMEKEDDVLLGKLVGAQEAVDAFYKADPKRWMNAVVRSASTSDAFWDRFNEDKNQYGLRAALQMRASKWWKTSIIDFRTTSVDSEHPLFLYVREALSMRDVNKGEKVDIAAINHPGHLAHLSKHTDAWTNADLLNGVRDRVTRQHVGPSFISDILQPVVKQSKLSPKEALDDFNSYLIARYAPVEWQRFIDGTKPRAPTAQPPGTGTPQETIAYFNAQAARYEADNPHFPEIAEKVYEWQRLTTKLRFDAGFLSQEEVDQYSADRYYVPMLRHFNEDEQPGGMGASGAKIDRGVRQKRGSSRDIIGPLDVITQRAFEYRKAIARNDVNRSLMDLARSVGPGGGMLAEEIDAKQLEKMGINIEAAIKRVAVERDIDPQDAQSVAELAREVLGTDAIATLYRRSDINMKPGIVFFYEAGKVKALQLGPGGEGNNLGQRIWENLNAFGETHLQAMSDIVKLAALPAQLIRQGVVTHPQFMLSNPVRDAWTANSYDRRAVPGYTQIRGMVGVLRNEKWVQEYRAEAGMLGGEATQYAQQYLINKDLQALVDKGVRMQAFKSLPDALAAFTKALGDIGQASLVLGSAFGGAAVGTSVAGPIGALAGFVGGAKAATAGMTMAGIGTNAGNKAMGMAIGAITGGAVGGPVGVAVGAAGGATIGGEGLAKFGEISELGTRSYLYKLANERALKNGLSPAAAAVEAAVAAHGYADYSSRGSKMATIAAMIPFFNASIQGNDPYLQTLAGRTDRGYKSGFVAGLAYPLYRLGMFDPAGLTVKEKEAYAQSAYAWMMAIYGLGAVTAAFALMYADDEDIKDVDERVRATHWLFKVPIKEVNVGGVIVVKDAIARVPKPFQMVWISQLIERYIFEAGRENSKWLEGYLSDLWQVWKPPMNPAVLDVAGSMVGVDFRLDEMSARSVVPEFVKMNAKSRADQFDAYTSDFGRYIAPQLGVSPMEVDHVIRKFGATWGQTALDLNFPGLPWYNSKKPVKGPEEEFIARRFLWQAGRGSEAGQALRKIMGAEDPLPSIWKRLATPMSQLAVAKDQFDDKMKAAGVPKRAEAVEVLERLTPYERGFAIMGHYFQGAQGSQYRMLHPMNRAEWMARETIKMEKEIVIDDLLSGRKGKDQKLLPLSPSEKGQARQMLTQLRMMETHNALVLTKEPGFAGRTMFDTASLRAEIKAAVPVVYKELVKRETQSKVLPWDGIARTWPDVKAKLEDPSLIDRVRQARAINATALVGGLYQRARATRPGSYQPAEATP